MTQEFDFPEDPELHWADYVVFSVFLVVSMLIGVIIMAVNKRRAGDSQADFLLGGSQMHPLPVALSLVASFLSSIYVVSVPTESYNTGISYSYVAISYIIVFPIIAFVFLPTFSKLKVTSAYEYLEMRFNRATRIAGSLTFVLMVFFYLSTVLYSPALTLEKVTPLPFWATVLLCGGVCIVYTVLGGMKATILNDSVQVMVIVLSWCLLIGLGYKQTGTISEVYDTAKEGGRINFKNFDPDPTLRNTFWTGVVGGTAFHMSMYSSSQSAIQKALSCKTLKDGQIAFCLAGGAYVICNILATWLGTVMYAFYSDCDPQLSGQVEKTDQLVPQFMLEIMGGYPGLPGLFVAACFSASLSSLSGSLNSLAAVFMIDFINPCYRSKNGKDISQKSGTIICKVLTFFFGCVVIVLAFMVPYMGDLVLQIAVSVFGLVGGPLTGVMLLGLAAPCCNSWGALSALIGTLGINLWIGIGAIIKEIPMNFLNHTTEGCPLANATWYNVSTVAMTTSLEQITSVPQTEDDILGIYYLNNYYYGLLAIVGAFVIGIPVSLITGGNKGVPDKYIYSCADNCYCYCPEPVKDCCRCGALPPEDEDSGFDDAVKLTYKKGSLEYLPGMDGVVNQRFEDNYRALDDKPYDKLSRENLPGMDGVVNQRFENNYRALDDMYPKVVGNDIESFLPGEKGDQEKFTSTDVASPGGATSSDGTSSHSSLRSRSSGCTASEPSSAL